MTEAERAEVRATLPSEFPLLAVPEGDPHFNAKVNARDTLRRHFERIGRKVYLACELPVYYPDEAMFAPDIIAVRDVELKERMSWIVSDEKKGLDLAIEVHVAGDKRKDVERNVERYARLKIPEYFVFEWSRRRLTGYRLRDGGKSSYQAIIPQAGRYTSLVLGLELAVVESGLRFFYGIGQVPDADQLIRQLEGMVSQVEARAEEEARMREEETRKREEETRKREDAEHRLAEALAELERLKGQR